MKKVLFFFAMVSLMMTGKAQQFNLYFDGETVNDGDTVTYIVYDEDVEVYVGLENAASAANTFQIQYEEINMEGLLFIGLCAGGDCVPEHTSASFTVEPGETYTGFHVAMGVNGTVNEHTHALIRLTFGDAETFANSKTIYVRIQSENYVGIEEAQAAEISIYPNPVADRLNIRCSNVSDNAQIVVLDMMGRPVMSQAMSQGSVLNTQKLAAGTYMVCVIDNGRNIGASQIVVE